MDNRTPRRFGRLMSIALAAATGLTPMVNLSLGSAGVASAASPSTIAHAPARPSTTAASMPSSPDQTTVEDYILGKMNADRVANGLRPLLMDGRLRSIARQRTTTMATLNDLSHTVAGDLGNELTAIGLQWYLWGEDIGWTTWPWGTAAADSLYSMWKSSPEHWTLMMSPDFDYVGVGIGYRPANAGTFSSIVFVESRDMTPPVVKMLSATRSGTTIVFTWRGADVALQNHTSGLKGFDVEYHRDGRTWRIIRTGTLATYLRLTGRVHRHTYYVRIRGVDKAGNVSRWSATMRIWVP